VSGTATNHKVYDTSSPFASSSHRAPTILVDAKPFRAPTNLVDVKPLRQSIKEYKRLPSKKAEVYGAAARDPYVPSTKAPPPNSHNASKASKGQQKSTPFEPPAQPYPFQMNRINLADLHADPNPTTVLGTAPTAPLNDLPKASVLPMPADSMIITSRSRGSSVTTKGKKGMLGVMTDFLKSHKRPEISRAYDPVHLTHVGFNSSTGEFTGLPKEWQQLLQDSGISKSDQEKNPLAVMEIVKFYQEGGGDVWDKMGHAPAPGSSSQSPPIPGTAHPAYPGLFKSVDDSFVSTVSVPVIPHSSILTVHSGRRYLFRKRPTPPVARMVHPHLTHLHHIALRHLHRSLRNLISTGLTHNDQYPSRLAMTQSPAQTLRRTGALRDHR
jgi:hypothetical protein